MSLAVAAAASRFPPAVSRLDHGLRLAVLIPLGVAVFLSAARLLRVRELEALRAR
jgi:hypothetical protein